MRFIVSDIEDSNLKFGLEEYNCHVYKLIFNDWGKHDHFQSIKSAFYKTWSDLFGL